MSDNENYEMKVFCNNCPSNETVHIPKGTAVGDYLHTAKCENCGVEGSLQREG